MQGSSCYCCCCCSLTQVLSQRKVRSIQTAGNGSPAVTIHVPRAKRKTLRMFILRNQQATSKGGNVE